MTRGLYILNPIFEGQKRLFKGPFFVKFCLFFPFDIEMFLLFELHRAMFISYLLLELRDVMYQI